MEKILTFSLIILALFSCSSKEKLSIGFEKNQSLNLPFDIAYEAEVLSKKDLKIKEYVSSEKVLFKLISGELDLAILPSHLIWKAKKEGNKLHTISYFQRNGGCLATRSNFDGDVAVLENSLEYLMLRKLNENDTINYKIVTYKNLQKMVKDYDERTIDAVCIKIPQLFDFPYLTKKIWFSDIFGNYPNFTIVAKEDYYQNNKQKIDIAISKLDKSCKFYNQDPLVSQQFIYNYCNISARHIPDFLHEMRFIISLNEKMDKFENFFLENQTR